MTDRPLRLLVVEDDEADAELLGWLCRRAGLRIARLTHARQLSDAVSAITDESFDLVLLDLALPDSQGVGTIGHLIDHSPNTPIVVLTGSEDETLLREAIRGGAQDFLVKGQIAPEQFRRSLLLAIERQNIVLELRRRAFTDGLTGLHNRQGFTALASHQLALAQRTGAPALLIYLDVDGLKLINDRFGHSAGDLALKHVADRLRRHCRDSDLVARIGGDEFAVLATEEGKAEGDGLAGRLRLGLQAPADSPVEDWVPALSLGVSRFDPAQPQPLIELLVEADTDMYQDKRRRGTPGVW